MKGDELAKKLRALAAAAESLGRVDGIELGDEFVSVRVLSVGARRQRKWRASLCTSPKASPRDAQRDASSPRAVTESVTARRTTRQPASVSKTVSPSVTGSVSPSRPSLGSLPGSPDPDLPKESVVAPKDLTGFPRESGAATTAPSRPQNHEEARQEPASFVAGLCMPGADPDRYDAQYASFVEVQRMPWVLEPVRAWRAARGDDRELMLDARSSEVKAMVRLVARGSMPSDLVRVARYLPTHAKYADKAHASCMTPDVVDIALAELREKPMSSPWARDLVRRADAAAGQPAALAALLPKVAGGGGE